MNTADRSIALVDLALRRRFYFVEFHPDRPPIEGLLRRWLGDNVPGMEWVADVVERANKLLEDDRHAAIGPSYFMKQGLDEAAVERVWKHSVLPYIEERRFGGDEVTEEFRLDKLRGEVASEVRDEDEEQADGGADERAMRQVNLREYAESEYMLSDAERDVLLGEAKTLDLSIAPIAGKDSTYYLRPGSTVGAVEIGGLSVLIQPKIGIPQLLSLACYAMGAYRLQEERLFDFEERVALPDALALCAGSGRAAGVLTRAAPRVSHRGGGALHRAGAHPVRRADSA